MDDYEAHFKDTDTEQIFKIRIAGSIKQVNQTADRVEAALISQGFVDVNNESPESIMRGASNSRFKAGDPANDVDVEIEMYGSRQQIRETTSNLIESLEAEDFEFEGDDQSE